MQGDKGARKGNAPPIRPQRVSETRCRRMGGAFPLRAPLLLFCIFSIEVEYFSMAEVRPLRGIRYNTEKVGNIADVVTPPYDVISKEAQDGLLYT